MTDLQQWAETEISGIKGHDSLCDVTAFLGVVSAPVGGMLLTTAVKLLNKKTKADEYYLAELYKIYQGTRFTKVTMEEAKRLFP